MLPLLGATLVIGGLASVSARAATTTTVGPPGPATFSHQVVVDQQRPGFEPDVKVAASGAAVNPGAIYSSVPFGFSSTESYIWSSLDQGNTYQLVPGNLPPLGKPITCVGGGDTDLLLDPTGGLYFSDLQGLTNLSQSYSGDGGATFTSNCGGAPNTPVDRMWLAATGSVTNSDLKLYQDYDAVGGSLDPTNPGGNELVETIATSTGNGTVFLPVFNANAGVSCPGSGVLNCVTNNEGISGNQVVNPTSGNLFISHTDATGSQVHVSEGLVAPHAVLPVGTQATWTESPVLDGGLCPDPTCISTSGVPEAIAGENFASIAQDSAGFLYVTFTFAPYSISATGTQTQSAPEAIYVVHSTTSANSTAPSALAWSAPQKISDVQPAGTAVGTNIFPWITAGSNGRVDVAWYHSDQASEAGKFGAGAFQHAEWSVEMGQSLSANATSPAYTTSMVTEHPVKYGQICTQGLACVSGGDRSLGDYLQVTTDNVGAAVVSYVDDTSADTANGEDAGPTEISRQIGGSSLLASVGTVPGAGGGPGVPIDAVSDPTGDAFYPAFGARTPAGDNLDLTGASLVDGGNNSLLARITVRSLNSLSVSPSVGGPDASWIIRWTYVTPGQTGNGHIYYAGMDNSVSGNPTFFDGDTSCIPPPGNPADHCKYMTFPQTNVLPSTAASYDAASGVITLHIPLADVGKPATGATLYSVTAFSATSLVPQSAATLFTLTDATTPFDHTISSGYVAPTGSGNGTGGTGTGTGTGVTPTVPNAGASPWAGAAILSGAIVLAASMVRRRRHDDEDPTG